MEPLDLNRAKLTVLLFGVFVTSFGVLAFEVALTRIFSVILDYHYTFLVVSLAIFGLGLGGIIAQRFPGKTPLKSTFSKLAVMALTFSLSSSVLTFVVASFPNLPKIAQVSIMFLPFLIAGTLLAISYKLFVRRSSVLHFADLIGAAVGSLAVVLLLSWVGATFAVLIVSLVTVLSAVFFAVASKRKIVVGLALLAIFGMAFFAQYSSSLNLWNVQPATDQEKELTNYLSDPSLNARIVDSRWTSFGQVELVASPELPHEKAIFVDGSAGTALYHFDGNFDSNNTGISRLRQSTQYLPYTFVKKSKALVIGPGGGLDVLTALMGGVNHIQAVEVNPGIVDIVRDYANFDGGIYTNYDNVHVNVDEGRSFLKRSNEKYDIIMLDIPISKTAQGTFGYALSENYLFTTDSFADYMNRLNDDGFLAVIAHNQPEIYKLTSIAFKVLGAQGLSNYKIMQRMAIVGADTMSHSHSALPLFMLRKTPISESQAELMRSKAGEMGLEASFVPLPNLVPADPALRALYFGDVSIDELVTEATFNMKAPTDDNPFFYNFELGIPLDLVMLLAAGIVLSVFVSVFYVVARRREERLFTTGNRKLLKSKFSLSKWFFFASLGLGFMLIEVALIQKFILFLGQPTMAIAASLFSLLIAGGIGSFFSRKWASGKQYNAFRISLIIALTVVVYIFVQPSIFAATLRFSEVIRFLISFLLISPLGFLMGIPFPTLLGYITQEAENDAALMWCINGGFSVLGSVLALVVAMSIGFNAVLLIGAIVYLGLFVVGTRFENRRKISVSWLIKRKHSSVNP